MVALGVTAGVYTYAAGAAEEQRSTLDQGGGGKGKRRMRGGVTDRASEQPGTRRRALPPSPRPHRLLPTMAGAAQRKTFRQDFLSRAGRSGPRWHFYCLKLLLVGELLPATAAVSSATTPRAAARHASAVERKAQLLVRERGHQRAGPAFVAAPRGASRALHAAWYHKN